MDLSASDLKTGDVYKTSYVTWNNFGLSKEDTDYYAYQVMAELLDTVGIHDGTMMSYHQTQADVLDYDTYIAGIEQLQYDILYGERYCYPGGITPYPATDLVMGIDDVIIESIELSEDGKQYLITGSGFTRWSRVYVNNAKFTPTYISGTQLAINVHELKDGASVVVSQIGASNTRFRDSNTYLFEITE